MSAESFLLTVAKIALGLGGLAGVVSVFRQSGRDWIPQEVAGMRLIFEHTFAAVFFALIPFPLFYSLDSVSAVWRISSLMLACFLLVEALIQIVRIRRLSARGTPPRRRRALLYQYFPTTALLFFVQILNAWREGTPSSYAWGLLWLLIAPGFQFFYFVLHISTSPSHGTESS
jgi:hypothetical protein